MTALSGLRSPPVTDPPRLSCIRCKSLYVAQSPRSAVFIYTLSGPVTSMSHLKFDNISTWFQPPHWQAFLCVLYSMLWSYSSRCFFQPNCLERNEEIWAIVTLADRCRVGIWMAKWSWLCNDTRVVEMLPNLRRDIDVTGQCVCRVSIDMKTACKGTFVIYSWKMFSQWPSRKCPVVFVRTQVKIWICSRSETSRMPITACACGGNGSWV